MFILHIVIYTDLDNASIVIYKYSVMIMVVMMMCQ